CGDGLAIQGPVDETVDLWIPDERRLRVTRIDQPGIEIARQTVGVREKELVETGHRWRDLDRAVEVVLPGYAVKEMNAAGSPPQPGHVPEIGIDVGIELHPAHVMLRENSRGELRAEDRRGVPRAIGRRVPNLETGIRFQQLEHRLEDREAQR